MSRVKILSIMILGSLVINNCSLCFADENNLNNYQQTQFQNENNQNNEEMLSAEEQNRIIKLLTSKETEDKICGISRQKIIENMHNDVNSNSKIWNIIVKAANATEPGLGDKFNDCLINMRYDNASLELLLTLGDMFDGQNRSKKNVNIIHKYIKNYRFPEPLLKNVLCELSSFIYKNQDFIAMSMYTAGIGVVAGSGFTAYILTHDISQSLEVTLQSGIAATIGVIISVVLLGTLSDILLKTV